MRSLGRLGAAVYGVRESVLTPAARSRYCRGTMPLPGPSSEAPALAAWLIEQARRIGERVLLIPVDDASAIFVADHAAALRERFVFPEPPPGLVRRLSSKAGMHELCSRHGIPTPLTVPVENEAALGAAAERLGLPLMLKRDKGWLPEPRRGPKMALVRDPALLGPTFDEMRAAPTSNLIAQEYVPGGPETVWMFNGYFDAGSRCRFAASGRKLRQYPVRTGPTTLGLCTENRAVIDAARRLLERVGYRGIVDIGYRYDSRDGLYKLLDVNPRIGSTFRLFAAADGTDVVRALYRDAAGEPAPAAAAVEGRRWLVENYDLVASAQQVLEGDLRPLRWLRSLRGIDETAWLDREDLLPFAAMAGYTARSALRRAARLRRGRHARG